jgi:hypothetical protein
VITITGIGDHLRPEWPITITGMRNQRPGDRDHLLLAARERAGDLPEPLLNARKRVKTRARSSANSSTDCA